MSMVKLIALDMDGTLLDDEKKLSDNNKRVLEKCIADGIYIVPCSGRTIYALPAEVVSIKGVRYCIATNGAIIKDIIEDRIISECPLENKLAAEIMSIGREGGALTDAYVNNQGITDRYFIDNMDKIGLGPEFSDMILRTRKVVDDAIEYVRDTEYKVEKTNLFFGDQEKRKHIRNILEKRDDIVVSSAIRYNLEVNAVGATKGEGIIKLSKVLGIKKEETMAIGDYENDRTMLESVGIGVAMENGSDELKSIADFITRTNIQDGVAYAIEHIVYDKR